MGKTAVSEKKVRRIKPLNILLIIVVVACVLMFGYVTKFLGKFTGETADDGSTIFTNAAAWDGAFKEVTLPETDKMVLIPAAEALTFNSEETEQVLQLGNPSGNSMFMKIVMMIGEQQIFETGILEPGKGIDSADLGTVFKPGSYTADMKYIFYERTGDNVKKLETVGTAEKEITVTAEGSGEKFETGTEKAK